MSAKSADTKPATTDEAGDVTAKKTNEFQDPVTGRFTKRPPGSGNKKKPKVPGGGAAIRERILDSGADPKINSQEVLRALSKKDPAAYGRLIVSLLPKQVDETPIQHLHLVLYPSEPPKDWTPELPKIGEETRRGKPRRGACVEVGDSGQSVASDDKDEADDAGLF